MKKTSKFATTHTFEVQNFGPILNASIELRPLTVFVGPSNTGKSYMATLLYAVHKFFESTARDGYRRFRFPESEDRVGSLTVQKILEQVSLDVIKFVEKNSLHSHPKLVLSDSIVEAFLEDLDSSGARLTNYIERYFGCDLEGLKNSFAKYSPRIQIRRNGKNSHDTESENLLDYEFGASSLGLSTLETLSLTPTESKNLIREVLSLKDDQDQGDELVFLNPKTRTLRYLQRKVVQHKMESITSRVFYIPADRTTVQLAQSELIDEALKDMTSTGNDRDFSTTFVTGVQADFLRTLLRALRPSPRSHARRFTRSSKSKKHAQSIEENVLRGTITVKHDQLVNSPKLLYRPVGWKDSLPLKNASSMVAEIGAIVSYLKYVVRPGDLLIVEEPESHLHPEMQVKLFRILAAMVNDGYRVLITTHSEWLIEELSNIVARSKIKPPINPNDSDLVALDSRMVGTWLFSPEIKDDAHIGSVVREVSLDENGLYPTGFNEVAQALHNDWVDITTIIDDQQ